MTCKFFGQTPQLFPFFAHRREVCIQLMDSIACVDGDFIIRERRDRYNEFVLTIRVKSEYKHHEIHCTEERKLSDRQCYIEESRKFSKLEDLVKYYREPKVCKL